MAGQAPSWVASLRRSASAEEAVARTDSNLAVAGEARRTDAGHVRVGALVGEHHSLWIVACRSLTWVEAFLEGRKVVLRLLPCVLDVCLVAEGMM